MKKSCFLPFLFFLLLLSSPLLRGNSACAAAAGSAGQVNGGQFYTKGRQLMKQGRYAEAVSYFQQAAEKKSNFAEAYLELGICYLKLSAVQKARQNLTFAGILASDPAVKQKADALLKQLSETSNPQTALEEPAGTAAGQESGGSLQNYGITGSLTPEGFDLLAVKSGSLAAQAGLKSGDVITKVDGSPVTGRAQIVSRLQNFEYTVKAVLLNVRRGNTVVQTGWPPVTENALTDTRLERIKADRASAAESLAAGKHLEAAGYLEDALSTSINYPYRDDVYLALAKTRLPAVTFYWKKPVPPFPYAAGAGPGVKKVLNDARVAMVFKAEKILAGAEEAYQSGEKYYARILQDAESAKTEFQRKGSRTVSRDFPGEIKTLKEKSAGIKSRYGDKRLEELQNFNTELTGWDFTLWVKCGVNAWWERTGKPRSPSYRPAADVTISNSSPNTDLNVTGVVQFIDNAGKVRNQVKVRFVCPAGGMKTVLAAGTTNFPQNAVWTTRAEIFGYGRFRRTRQVPVAVKPWRVRILIGGIPFGDYPLG